MGTSRLELGGKPEQSTPEGLAGANRRERRGNGVEQALAHPVLAAEEHIAPVGKVAVEGPLGQPRAFRDGRGTGRRVPLLGE